MEVDRTPFVNPSAEFSRPGLSYEKGRYSGYDALFAGNKDATLREADWNWLSLHFSPMQSALQSGAAIAGTFSTVTTGTLTVSSLIQGSALFAGPGGVITQSNPFFFFDSSNSRLGVGTSTPDRTLDVLNASSPQLRLTQTDNSVYAEEQVDSSGRWTLTTTGNEARISYLTSGSVLFASTSGKIEQNNSAFFWDNANLCETITGTTGKQLRLAYDSTHYVDFLLTTGSGGYNQFFQITPKTAAFPNAFCGWRLQGSDFCFSYEGDDVPTNSVGVPNVTIRGPASSGYAASSGPALNLYNNKSGADTKFWGMYLNDATLTYLIQNDAGSVSNVWMSVNRSGATPGSVNFLSFLNLGGSTFGANTGDIGVNGQVLTKDGSASSPGLSFGNLPSTGFYCISASGGDIDVTIAGTTYARYLGNEIRLSSANQITWATGDPTATSSDVGLSRNAAKVLQLKSGSNDMSLYIYGSGSVFTQFYNNGTNGYIVPSSGQLAFGFGALGTTATSGFICIQSCAGPPTGTPGSIPSGQIPMVWDSTNLQLYVYTGGNWKKSAVFT